MSEFTVIFDNGGFVTFQTENYAHTYPEGKQAGEDVKALLAGSDPADWDGNEPDAQCVTCTAEDERNGGARRMDEDDVRAIIAAGKLDDCWGYNMRDFFVALSVTITDDNYAR